MATCVRLGFWQLDRLDQRRTYNAALRTATALPVLELDSQAAQAVAQDPARFINRRVRARGSFDPSGEVVLRGRSQGGRPGVHVVTPLRLAGSDAAVMVNRGWARAPDALTVNADSLREPGVQSVEGLLLAVPAQEVGPQPAGGTWLRLHLPTMKQRVGYPLLPLYIQQLAPSSMAASLQRVPPPELSEGSHLSYAVQWFSFAAIALIGFAVMVWRRD